MQLASNLTQYFKLTELQKSALAKLGITTVRDLLYHFPFRYEQAGGEASVGGLTLGMEASIIGVLEKMETKKSWKSRRPVSEGYLRDSSGRIKLRWFNQPYIAKMYLDGTRVRAVGKVSGSAGKLYLANPELQKVSLGEENLFAGEQKSPAVHLGNSQRDLHEISAPPLFAMYPESKGVTSLWFRHAVAKIIKEGALESIEDPIPAEIVKRRNKTSILYL